MANRRPRRGNQPSSNQAQADAADQWFVSADSHLGGIAAWDIKSELFVRTLLALLATGRNIGLYSAWHGEALSIRIYDGDAKHDTRIRDSVDWDDAWGRIADRLRREGVDIIQEE